MTNATQNPDLDLSMLDGLSSFIDRYVVPLEGDNEAVLEDQSSLYGPGGGYSDKATALIRQVRQASAEAGYYNAFSPAEIGGAGLGSLMNYLTWEHLYHLYGPGRLLPYQTVAHWTNGPSFLIPAMSQRMRDQIQEPVVNGHQSVCFAMSEPDAGSDAWSMSTRAVQDGQEWVINGTKQWISFSPIASYAFVFAVTDDELRRAKRGGISCFVVPVDTPGFRIDSVIRLFGQMGGNEAIIGLSDVRVPLDSLVGELHQGFPLAMQGVSKGRMYNAGRCVGLARWALETATEYAKTRKAFGQTISNYQGVSFMLAESAMEIYAAKMMSEDCARRLDEGERGTRNMAMVKAYTTEMCCRVYDRCMQVFGGMGLTNETKLYDGWHQSRIVRIADGSGEIMRKTISSYLFKGETGF